MCRAEWNNALMGNGEPPRGSPLHFYGLREEHRWAVSLFVFERLFLSAETLRAVSYSPLTSRLS